MEHDIEKVRTARHEAAHAVVGRALGGLILHAHIEKVASGCWDGWVEVDDLEDRSRAIMLAAGSVCSALDGGDTPNKYLLPYWCMEGAVDLQRINALGFTKRKQIVELQKEAAKIIQEKEAAIEGFAELLSRYPSIQGRHIESFWKKFGMGY